MVRWPREHDSDSPAEQSGRAATQSAEDPEEVESRLTVREAWTEFLRLVSVRYWRTKTPGQVERVAIERDDLPPDAVRLLTDSFRDVEYGDRAASDRVSGAKRALQAIEESRQSDDGGDD